MITRTEDIKTAIVAAPMAGASGGALAAQVSRAGGFGFMAAGVPSHYLVIFGLCFFTLISFSVIPSTVFHAFRF